MTSSRHLALLVLLSVLASASGTLAQPAGGRPSHSLISLTVDGAFTGRTDFEARGQGAGDVAVMQTGVKLSVPLPPLGSQWFSSIGLEYRDYELDRSPGTPVPETLRSLGASLSVFGALTPDWKFIGRVSPSLANAGGGFTSRGLGVGVLALATRRFSPEFGGGFGVVYDSLARGTGRLLPIATFDWAPAPAWRLFLGFPRTGASWQAAPSLLAEFVAEADFGSFYVTDDPAPRAAGRPALDRTRLEYRAVRVGPALTWNYNPAAHVRLAAGVLPVLEVDYHRRGYKLKSDGAPAYASLELEWKF
ncbi:MAG: DUF6268 family outer membrane beta-barrel protein [Opitutaceae bacterium]|nr:DUF6268 family outer membrane beta-barrel protein [Opitutaceae bacterium]